MTGGHSPGMFAPVCIQCCTVSRMRCIHGAHYTPFTSVTLLGEEETVSLLLLVCAVSLYLFRLQFSCC